MAYHKREGLIVSVMQVFTGAFWILFKMREYRQSVTSLDRYSQSIPFVRTKQMLWAFITTFFAALVFVIKSFSKLMEFFQSDTARVSYPVHKNQLSTQHSAQKTNDLHEE